MKQLSGSWSQKLNKTILLLTAAALPLVLALFLLGGDIPDPDRNAHDMWANQLLSRGKLIISENGICNNWQLYYPNTVPKPLELVIGLFRAPGGTFLHSAIALLTALLVLASVWYSAGGGRTGYEAAFFLGLNPVFIFLAIRGNPAIPFLGALFLMQAAKGSSTAAVLASLARPEGFIYSTYHCVKNRKWKLLMLLGLAAIVWLVFHRMTCGSFTWAPDEVKFSVASMDYPTANPVTFFPWAGLRSILVLGAPAAAVVFLAFKRWKLIIPFSANFLLLALSLAMGSLVLPRYIDQLFLLATPFVFLEINRVFKGRTRTTVVIIAILFPSLQWIGLIPEIREYEELREVYSTFELPEEGIVATNELLIPGFCLNLGILDPRERFVSIDRAAWSEASEADLKEAGVTLVVIVPRGMYFPMHTEKWLEQAENIEVEYLGNFN